MRVFKSLFIVLLFSSSCNSFDEKEVKNEVFSPEFKNYQLQNNLELINLDTINTYSELRKEMSRIDCSGKVAGLKFSYNQVHYNTLGFAYCPNISEDACYFTPNQFTIKNDSFIKGFKKRKSIEHLNRVLDTTISNKYNFRYKQNKLKPAVIFLYVEDKHSIVVTKKVLKEIIEQFNRVNSDKSPDYFKYTILFEGYSLLDIPPPPPPPVENNKLILN
ncbi:hypothetical protein FPF71_17040 [Algibacter amylolyticus]|uniref:Lipoprotein n=1 Tax=Algibacter amylolyticus TaxID=1608400 RepID=A0A5M7B0I8_9FLAO|nr:hypothetical protein [Algibacter amylolyticus]KAA5820845.1 hypothetical protein F2B50_17040 [Algibacter amylolyticus]MBB5269912.1 hypothetical protein [Algibacter amylolyticus]TSJ71920.1 hypothetical protein FPF71_17040 [Algibacter amylolyticus]